MTKQPPPDHYPAGTYEPWLVIDAWGLGYGLGNVLKYISRAGKKGPALDDLVKARNYLDREIDKLANAVLEDEHIETKIFVAVMEGDHRRADALIAMKEALEGYPHAEKGTPCK